MIESAYKLRRVGSSLKGMTNPRRCTLDAVLKRDGDDLPYCVYSEYVALRLAQTLHIPVADGALTDCDEMTAYASLKISTGADCLPEMKHTAAAVAAVRYADMVAALTAYDILIGNWDRAENLMAATNTASPDFFRAYDHSHALLGIAEKPAESIKRLADCELIVTAHPFYSRVRQSSLELWAVRIASLPDMQVTECCVLEPFAANVATSIKKGVAAAMVIRKNSLPSIIRDNKARIDPQP